ncbi:MULTISPECIES: cell wall metabolism sensor histidine kinase WalK [unclassified Lactococcus]|uniref:sensor histidine kinase n=1 Tax=unclassified Lactococcus TaxID=2643510 RepID=UPI0011C887DE|nr:MULTISPECIES: HAMP domain-containing sensor histidine kinase [unclassified Lactococcus]MQW23075.1 HAMP domain-containing protein [Lactococcus sp. dk101]TXK44420.1 HAMP domain-containing histidine kinase [Lactococcus sp. dk310]TXK50230.1 HAMP domain-containing histidine kinase [Lactococcus sp. dk322]
MGKLRNLFVKNDKTHRFRDKISVKISFLYLILILLIELWLFVGFYLFIFNSVINNQVNSLVNRGENFSSVLSMEFDTNMVKHAIMLEKNSSQEIVIQNENHDIIGSSNAVTAQMQTHIKSLENVNSSQKVLHYQLFKDDYIVSMNRIEKDGKILGTVYLFLETKPIRQTLLQIGLVFLLLLFLTFILTAILTYYLSRKITKPLLELKDTTEKIANGAFDLTTDIHSQDEIGDLAHAIENLASRLNQLQKQRNEFLSAVAHELRTPLTLIKGYADFASRKNVSENQRSEYLSIIKEEIERLTKLVENLMTLARLEENEFTISKKETNLAELIQQVATDITLLLKDKQMLLNIQGNANFSAQIDPVRIQQVLTNLLMNAYKYSPEKSTITLSVRADKADFSIVIRDEGPGISEENLPHIFDRFYRVDSSRTRKTGGFGLGLSIVKDIISLHGGQISAESIENQGTKIKIRLPYH